MDGDEAAVFCYGWDAVNEEWIPIVVDAAGEVEVTA